MVRVLPAPRIYIVPRPRVHGTVVVSLGLELPRFIQAIIKFVTAVSTICRIVP